MNFRTQVERPERVTEIGYSDHLLLLGSCFAENIGKLLLANKFCCDVNPYGILYNPLSIARTLQDYDTVDELLTEYDRMDYLTKQLFQLR